MPVSLLLEGVAGAQNQRFFHMPTNNLEADRKAIAGPAAGQCQRWMPAHIERYSEAEFVPQSLPVCGQLPPGLPTSVRRGS